MTAPGSEPSRRRSPAWIAYSILAVILAIGGIASDGVGTLLLALAVAAALGLYARYLYRGGSVVFLPLPGCLLSTLRFALVLTTVVALVAGCGSPELSSASTCEEFLAADQQARAQIADRLYTAKRGQANSMGSSLALVNMEAACDHSPDRLLSDLGIWR